jgi:beta-glucanase (GH16 family)
VVSGAQTGASVGSGGNYLFDDEFDGTAVNPSLWSVIDRGGDASNHEAQCYLPANVSEGNGNLRITSKVDSSCKGYRHTSGMVQWATATFTYGSIEIRAKQSGGQGRCHPPTRTGTSTA